MKFAALLNILPGLALASGLTLAPGAASANADLAKAKNCLACHAIDKKLVGPAYKDIAKKYAGDRGAEANLAKKIREGGVGAWGQIPMPSNPQASADEARTLARWVLSLK